MGKSCHHTWLSAPLGPVAVPRIASVCGNSIHCLEIQVEIEPMDAKPIVPAAAWPVLRSAQCSSHGLLLLGFGKDPKELDWVSQGKPNPCWDKERWESGCNQPWGPRHAAGAFGVSSMLLPTRFHLGCSWHMALLQEIPS